MWRKHAQQGFTLTELMVVIGIIVLVSLMTIPVMIPFMRGQRMRAGARIVQSAILRARTQAIRQRAIYQVQFNQTYQKMTISDLDDNLVGKEIKLPDTISFGKFFDSSGSPITDSAATIQFTPFGYAVSATVLHAIKLYDASRSQLTLAFQKSTGQVRRPR